ncbi:MAG TPA: CocE/NonD family hydrolase [Candidatus Xenobia bacterium]|nr:CocE/NonD family hydrolase [Candidatus Xenobia bacterium]
MRKVLALLILLAGAARATGSDEFHLETDVAVPMRDGVVLRADVWRPAPDGRFPVLVYRTPYDKRRAREDYTTFRRAVERGYAVVIQDVRGRFASDGEFVPYRNEGRDGYDTIEWAAAQPWSTGKVGTFGLSYPGAAQWLAAVERPPHLKAMVPAMTFSTPRNFFYSGGVFDLSWIGWIWNNIAPEERRRRNLPGPRSYEEARAAWRESGDRLRAHLPLRELPELRDVAPYYYQWLSHPPGDPWWSWAELRGKYARVDAAVLNLSGWYDEAYGPEGALTNFRGLVEARKGAADKKTQVIIGPWVHGVDAVGQARAGGREFEADARADYDKLVLDWMDRYVRGVENGVECRKPVRFYVLGSGWREEDSWPPAEARPTPLYLARSREEGKGRLSWTKARTGDPFSLIASDPAKPVWDPHAANPGAHDYRSLEGRRDVLVFDSEPLKEDLEVTGTVKAEIFISVDAPDTDLWIRLLDVAPDATAFNLMSPGLDVLRASYRDGGSRKLLRPGRVYRLILENLATSNLFRKGHRIRVQISTTFFPHFSRNLHTGGLEMESSESRPATLRIHHDHRRASRIWLPVVQRRKP